MKIQGKHYHTIWLNENKGNIIEVIDQRKLPFKFETLELKNVSDVVYAIKEMVIRGAPLIGITAAYGMYLALVESKGKDILSGLKRKADLLKSARPTAVNLENCVNEMMDFILAEKNNPELMTKTLEKVHLMKKKEIEFSSKIGDYGFEIIKNIYHKKKETVQILTHCNAGWLACIDWGTATAPIYKAHRSGIPLHVWVDETRPRNQGARLTAFELGEEGIEHTVISDNTGGHLMQHHLVDLVLVGSDRTTASGDVANKIGTYLKALAAKDNNVPFYVALPSSSFDWNLDDGVKEIPIEERNQKEVAETEGWDGTKITSVKLIPAKSKAANFGFDVTPARLITGLITERGICSANKKSIISLFPEKNKA